MLWLRFSLRLSSMPDSGFNLVTPSGRKVDPFTWMELSQDERMTYAAIEKLASLAGPGGVDVATLGAALEIPAFQEYLTARCAEIDKRFEAELLSGAPEDITVATPDLDS
jgi:hypothetical protein